jgi:curli production assembly/transport component CsgG
MYSKYLMLVFFIPFLFCTSVFSQGTTSIAVLELDAKGISKSDASIITDRLRAELFNSNKYIVLERDKMHEILTEQGFQFSGCTTDECVVELGKLVGVQQIVGGKIGKIGNLYTIIVRIIDVQTGKVLKVATDDCNCPIEQVLTKSVKKISQMLTNENYYTEVQKTINTKLKDPFTAVALGFIMPIAGHGYVGGSSNIIRGALYTAAGATGIILGLAWDINDDGITPFLAGIGVLVVSAIDAGVSASNYNAQLKSQRFSLNLNPKFINKSISISMAYNF